MIATDRTEAQTRASIPTPTALATVPAAGLLPCTAADAPAVQAVQHADSGDPAVGSSALAMNLRKGNAGP